MPRLFVFTMELIQRCWLLTTVLLLTLITTLSLIPLPELPLAKGSDKLHHLIAYAALIVPVALRLPKQWLSIIVGFVGWGGVIELIQPHVNRHAEWADLIANSLGLLIGFIVATVLRRKFLMLVKK